MPIKFHATILSLCRWYRNSSQKKNERDSIIETLETILNKKKLIQYKKIYFII